MQRRLKVSEDGYEIFKAYRKGGNTDRANKTKFIDLNGQDCDNNYAERNITTERCNKGTKSVFNNQDKIEATRRKGLKLNVQIMRGGK